MPLKNKDMLDLEQITKKVREIALQGGACLLYTSDAADD